MDESDEDQDEEEEDFRAGNMTHSYSDRGAPIGQETDTPFIYYPPSETHDTIMYRRTAARQTDNGEVNPRAEIVTSSENNNPGADHHRHASQEDYAGGSVSIVDEDFLTLQSLSLDVPAYTAKVRTGSESSGSHSPRQETSITEVPGEQEEECVPNTEHDHAASRFRTRYALLPGCSTESTQQPAGETTGYGRDLETRPEIPTESLEVTSVRDLFDLLSYDGRLETYRLYEWDHDFLSAEVLAEAGFFYNGEEDLVECVKCRGQLSGWERGDDPRDQHKKHFKKDCF